MLKVLQGFYRACHGSKSEVDFGRLEVKSYENIINTSIALKKSTSHKKYKIKPMKTTKIPTLICFKEYSDEPRLGLRTVHQHLTCNSTRGQGCHWLPLTLGIWVLN